MSLFNKKESKLSNYLDGYKKTNKSLAVKITELLGGYSANNDDIYEDCFCKRGKSWAIFQNIF